MSESELEDAVDESGNVTDLSFIAEKAKDYPEILSKSQIPSAKKKKEVALERIVAQYVSQFGKEMTAKGFQKKLQNMKTRLKTKTDKKKTGNRKIRLLPWEKVLHDAMQGDTNPVVQSVPGKKCVCMCFILYNLEYYSTQVR